MTISIRSTHCQGTAISTTSFPGHWYCGLTRTKARTPRGMTWTIPEYALDKALATYRKQEHTFRQRIKKAAMYLSPRDAEAIILLASHNIVRLELVILPIQAREKPYYL